MRLATIIRSLRAKRGAAAVEFAIWLPVLVLFLSAVVDWGWYMTQRVAVARATMDGARVAAAIYEPRNVPPGSIIKPRAEQRAKDVLNGLGMPCTTGQCLVKATYCAAGAGGICSNPPFAAIVVEVQYRYDPFFGFVATPADLYERFLMAVENQP